MKITKRILTVAVCAAMTASMLSFSASAQELPEKYDLRTEDVLSDVRDQGMVGSCWAFGSLSILENWLRSHDMGDYDFSERHMDTVTTMAYADSFNKETGDASRLYSTGGTYITSLSYFFSGRGPVLEADYPYIPTSDGKYPRTRREAECKTAGISVKDIGFGSCIGDMTITSGSKFSDIISEMKLAISEYGSITASYYATADDNTSFFTAGYDHTPNHQIAIVGWDDNYPKENFTGEYGNTPLADGAWIVRNSWGTEFGEDGYFYLSYETSSLYRESYYYLERAAKTDYDQIYLSSPLAATDYITSSVDDGLNTDYSLNLFEKTAGSQSVTQVTAALREGTSYDIYVISDYENGGENFGKRVASGYADHDCYKTVEFDPVEITGDTFGICIRYTNQDHSVSQVPVQNNQYSTSYYTGEEFTGKSFISHDGKAWKDTAKHYDSTVFVRAYTVNNNETHNVSLPSGYTNETAKLYQNGTEVYKAPDGSFNVESGAYQYEISCMGYETLTGSITVKDKDVKLPYKKLKPAPTIADVNTTITLKDSGDYEIYYLYGINGEAPKKVTSVEIGGRKVDFTQTSQSINVDRAQLDHLKAGDTVEIKVTYSNGAVSSATVRAEQYSDMTKADILAKKASEEISKLKITCEKDIINFASDISQTLEKYTPHAVTRITDGSDTDDDEDISYSFTAPSADTEGSYSFTLEIRYMNYVKTLNVSGKIDALGESVLSPEMDGLSGWQAIAGSDALKDAVKNGGEVTVTLGSDGIIPESFVKEIAGTKAVISFKSRDGRYSWKINCSDIKNIHDIDTNIYDGTDLSLADDSILSTSLNKYIMSVKNLPFYVDKSFDFSAELTLDISNIYAKFSGNYIFSDRLFAYDKDGVLEQADHDGAIITCHSGKTRINDMTSGNYVLMLTSDQYIYGDINMDAAIPDKSDIRTLKLYIAMGGIDFEELKEINPLAYALLDINEDDAIDSGDIEALEEYVTKLEKEKEAEKK
ncbi:MAG: C1 family peptidase [Oscillospiraceae bacterium]